MRGVLADPSLARYAGQFVWLALDFDKPENAAFMARHGTVWTPMFYVIDPSDDHAIETTVGAMTVGEVKHFLDRGLAAPSTGPADAALAHAEQLRQADAVDAYRSALELGGPSWPARPHALGGLAAALTVNGRYHECAQLAVDEAPHLPRDADFARLMMYGLGCAVQTPTPWPALEQLAAEAVAIPGIARDHRYQLYRWLIAAADARGDREVMKRWGDRWLGELDAAKPATDDERL